MPAWQGSVEETIAFLIQEGKPQDQAAAIAHDLAREHGISKRRNLLRFEFRKVGEDPDPSKPLTVVGWASVVTKADGTPIEDYDGQIIPFDELEKAFADFALTGGMQRGGEMHETIGGADIIGQITLNKAERIALGFGAGPEGAIVKIRVKDPELKRRIRSGELSELSIAGEGLAEQINSEAA